MVKNQQTTKIGQRGTIVIPAELRERVGLREGTLVIAEERDGGILLRPAAAVPIEHYSVERKAEFLLNNAITADDYRRARDAVKRLGLDPDAIDHERPQAA